MNLIMSFTNLTLCNSFIAFIIKCKILNGLNTTTLWFPFYWCSFTLGHSLTLCIDGCKFSHNISNYFNALKNFLTFRFTHNILFVGNMLPPLLDQVPFIQSWLKLYFPKKIYKDSWVLLNSLIYSELFVCNTYQNNNCQFL